MSAADNRAQLQGTQIQLPPEIISGFNIQIALDSSDQRVEDKYAALRRAIELVGQRVPNAFNGLPNLPVFFGLNVKCEACWEPERNGGSASLFLGDRMMFQANKVEPGQDRTYGQGKKGPRGVADQIYDEKRKFKGNPARWWKSMRNQYQASKASAKATAVVIHEIGHILHEQRAPLRFWNNKKVGADPVPANIAMQVSSYLFNNNFDEFVAEVFTGLVHGRHYSPEVLEAYENQGGPRVA